MDNFFKIKYSTDDLLKRIQTPLKLFKNKKQVSKKFNCSDVFPTDPVPNELKNNQITILCNHYLNALKYYKVLELISEDTEKLKGRYRDQILNLCTINKEISFFKIYEELISHGLNNNFLRFNTLKFYNSDLFNIFYKSDEFLSDYLTKEKWTLSNNNLRHCVATGFIFRKNDVVQLNQSREYNLNNYKGLYHFRNYKLETLDYIHTDFLNQNNEGSRYTIHFDYDLSDSVYSVVYDSELKYAQFDYDLNYDENVVKLKSANGHLRSYSFPVHHYLPKAMLPHEKKTEKDNLYFGVELEVGYQRSVGNRRKLHLDIEQNYLKGLAICKSDGSVSNGFEINTTPMTFDFIKTTDVFFNFFNHTKNSLRSYSMRSTGIHIHVSKRPLSTLQIGKMLEFVNSRKNRDFIIELSGRNPNTYCEINDILKCKDIHLKEYGTDGRNMDNRDYRALDKMNDKYQAVNLQHSETVEFRIFKGNTKPQTISRYIEFVHGLVMFSKNGSNQNLTYKDFIKWVSLNKNTYPFLNEFNQKFLGNEKAKLKEEFTYAPKILKQNRGKVIEIKKPRVFTEHFKKRKNRKIIKR
mgnify:CR=1 FL=1